VNLNIVDMIQRTLYENIWEELSREKGMIFLAGPRQAGKTTLAKKIATNFSNRSYFNWDNINDQKKLLKNPYYFEEMGRIDDSSPLIVLDEIHKYGDWKNYLKGVYDTFHEDYTFLISGSGRLDLYQRGGDSLAGRYFMFHLWPLTLGELAESIRDDESFFSAILEVDKRSNQPYHQIWKNLMNFSGFPEPYLKQNNRYWTRWTTSYNRQLIREDIQDLTHINNIQQMELLFSLLPERVGSPLSLNVLAELLKVSFNTVKSWIEVFERFFLGFRISPWTQKVSRAIQKEKKMFLFNTPLIESEGARFENAVAIELYRAISTWNDLGIGLFGLHYVRNKEKQEVDFLISRANRPVLLLETKSSIQPPTKSLRKFQKELQVPAIQLYNDGDEYRYYTNDEHKILLAPAWRWLSRLT